MANDKQPLWRTLVWQLLMLIFAAGVAWGTTEVRYTDLRTDVDTLLSSRAQEVQSDREKDTQILSLMSGMREDMAILRIQMTEQVLPYLEESRVNDNEAMIAIARLETKVERLERLIGP